MTRSAYLVASVALVAVTFGCSTGISPIGGGSGAGGDARRGAISDGIRNRSSGEVQISLVRFPLNPLGGIDDLDDPDGQEQVLDALLGINDLVRYLAIPLPGTQFDIARARVRRVGSRQQEEVIIPTLLVFEPQDRFAGQVEQGVATLFELRDSSDGANLPFSVLYELQQRPDADADARQLANLTEGDKIVEVVNDTSTVVGFRLFTPGAFDQVQIGFEHAYNRGFDIVLPPGSVFREWTNDPVLNIGFHNVRQSANLDDAGDDLPAIRDAATGESVTAFGTRGDMVAQVVVGSAGTGAGGAEQLTFELGYYAPAD